MKKLSLKTVVGFGILCLTTLIAVQFFWAKNILELERKQFNHKAKIALSNAGYQLRLFQHESISSVHPVKQIGIDQFVVQIQDIINPLAIDSILQSEFKKLEIELPYQIGIYDCFTDSVVYSIGGSRLESRVPARDFGVNWNLDSYNFGVKFLQTGQSASRFYIWSVASASALLMALLIGFLIYKMLQQKKLDELKSDFINNITHELKTPISTIALSIDSLRESESIKSSEENIRYASIISDENKRLKNLVDSVLEISMHENDEVNFNKEMLDLKALLMESIKPFELRVEKSQGRLLLDLQQEIKVDGDHEQLTNLFRILLDNAVKYSPEQPDIKITAREENGRVNISINDQGTGIAKDQIGKIFSKFYRVPTGDIHNVKGFGIGLHYAKLIVDQHNGTIEISSEENIGTTVFVKLPKSEN